MKIKNWKEFQHYKDRDPKWIKLYTKLLNDDEWFNLDPKHTKVLVMLWLLASEDPLLDGNLPSLKKVAFRLRMSESSLESMLSALSHWVERPASNTLAASYQPASLELETERELETESSVDEFELFWKAYPKKRGGKKNALKAWSKAQDRPDISIILTAIESAKRTDQWKKDNGQFIPYPATWLNRGMWADEGAPPIATRPTKVVL